MSGSHEHKRAQPTGSRWQRLWASVSGGTKHVLLGAVTIVIAAWAIALLGPGECGHSIKKEAEHDLAECYAGVFIEWLASLRHPHSSSNAEPAQVAQAQQPGLRPVSQTIPTELAKAVPQAAATERAQLELTLTAPDFAPGCNGTLGFRARLHNPGARRVPLNLDDHQLMVVDSYGRHMRIDSRLGNPGLDCYHGGWNLPVIDAGQSVDIAIRLSGKIVRGSPIEFRFTPEAAPELQSLNARTDLN